MPTINFLLHSSKKTFLVRTESTPLTSFLLIFPQENVLGLSAKVQRVPEKVSFEIYSKFTKIRTD